MKSMVYQIKLKLKDYFNPITLINVWIYRNFKCDNEPAIFNENGSIIRYKGHRYQMISQSKDHRKQKTKC
jgi:hypothetical protein